MSYWIQLYTVRKAVEEDLAGTIQRLAEIGFTMVEPYRFVAKAAELKQALAENNLTAPSGHAPLLSDDQDAIFAPPSSSGSAPSSTRTFRSSAGTGSKTSRKRRSAQRGRRQGRWLRSPRRIPQPLVGSGVRDRRQDRDRTPRRQPGSGSCPGTRHLLGSSGRPEPGRAARPPRRPGEVHSHQGRPVTSDPSSQLAVGDGKMPIWDVLDAARSLEAAVVELDDFQGDMFDAVRDSYNYLSAGKVSA